MIYVLTYYPLTKDLFVRELPQKYAQNLKDKGCTFNQFLEDYMGDFMAYVEAESEKEALKKGEKLINGLQNKNS